jgi:hypothetical protein
MKTLLTLLALASLASAFPARFKWNKNPAGENITEYRIHQLVDGVPVLRLTHPATAGPETFERSTALEVETGQVYTVTAFNGFASEPSDPLTVPAVPTKPGAVEVVEIEVSSNLTDWEPVAFVTLKTDDPARFIRTRIITVTK